jgi:hypothetical protein
MSVTWGRDPIIRRQALRLLHKCDRKEGIWESRPAARVAQQIVEIEEAGAISMNQDADQSDGDISVVVTSAHQIPESARVQELEAISMLDRQGKIRYRKSMRGRSEILDAASTGQFEELMEW